MKSPIPSAARLAREDVSDYLWHFCREDQNPEEAIRAIMRDKKILASEDHSTGERVVCFTEMPLEQAKRQMPVLRQNAYTRFSSYGIGFLKSFVFHRGGLPVIYQPSHALADLPTQLKWRHVELDFLGDNELGYSWQREWRIKGELDFSSACDDAIVVVPDESAYEGEIFDVEMDGDYEDGEMVSFPSYTRIWKSISLTWVNESINDQIIRVASGRA